MVASIIETILESVLTEFFDWFFNLHPLVIPVFSFLVMVGLVVYLFIKEKNNKINKGTAYAMKLTIGTMFVSWLTYLLLLYLMYRDGFL